jgi:hypothetical protein
MKKFVRLFPLLFLGLMVPVIAASGQDKKTEKKVKVIIDDGSGATVVVDTVFTNSPLPDSIVSKNGKVIYFNPGKAEAGMDGKHQTMTVLVSSDGDKPKKEERTIIVTGGDTFKDFKTEGDGSKQVYAYATTSDGGGGKVITIRDGKDGDEKTEKHIRIDVRDDKNEAENDMSKYVIARNGVVVTVECNDEAKARDIIKAVESKLGTDKSDSETEKIGKKSDKK